MTQRTASKYSRQRPGKKGGANVRAQAKGKSKAKTAGKNGRSAGSGQRRGKSRAKKAAPQVRKSVQSALYTIYTISVIFFLLVILSLAFLLYQWKDYQITQYVKENQQLQAEVLRLGSELGRKQGKINTDLLTYYRISEIASKELGLKPPPPDEVPRVLTVDRSSLEHYAQKDKEAEE